MSPFVDPRTRPKPSAVRVPARTTTDEAEFRELLALCKCGDLYEVERWIQAGRPLQPLPERARVGLASASPLRVALKARNRSLVVLLLCNGYNPDLDEPSPLDWCLRAREWELLDLLLDWGADPHRVTPYEVYCTFQSELMERFRALGVDMTRENELAWALAEHASNKPAFGYAKRHRRIGPSIQRQLDLALGHHAHEGNEKGVALCLWAGANPHATTRTLQYYRQAEDEEDPDADGWSAIWEACTAGHAEILERLGPDPALDDFDDLFRWAKDRAVVDILAQRRLPSDMGPILAWHIAPWSCRSGGWSLFMLPERLFELGARWNRLDLDRIADMRRSVLKLSDRNFEELVRLITKDDYCSPEVLSELARTSAFRRRLREVGFLPTKKRDRPSAVPSEYAYRKVLSKLGIELPKPAPEDRPLRPVVWIGRRRPGTQERRLTRQEIFDHVWATPIVQLAPEWGLSDQGLHKACRRLRIPRPPRGWWAKAQAGRRVRRPKLPKLPEGQGGEVIVWERVP